MSFKRAAAENLKKRLWAFWNAQQSYWDMTSSEEFVDSPARQLAASFLPKNEPVLDIACGTAANSAWLKESCRYFGIDLSMTALKKPVDPALYLTCGDADHLPFSDGSFGGVIATYVLEHTVTPVETLEEITRVVKTGGRIVLLGPAWDFPFWAPNSLNSKSGNSFWRLRYTLGRLWQHLLGWLFGRLPFVGVEDPDAFHYDFIYDADVVYIMWTYEIIRLMKQRGHKLVYWKADTQLLGTNFAIRSLKGLLLKLPIYRYAGSTLLLVFEK
jgi:SAM-dependent methyltransferase